MKFLFFTAIVALLETSGTSGTLTVRPDSKITLIGFSFQLKCGTNSTNVPVAWYHQTSDSSPVVTIFQDNTIQPCCVSTYNISRVEVGRYDLVVNATALSVAGIYRCGDANGIQGSESAACNVTVCGVPTFNLSSLNAIENDTLSATCQADYRGIFNPSVEFQQSNSKVNLGNVTDMSILNQVAGAAYNFTATYDLNGVVMSCTVASFSATQQLALNISFSVRDIFITPRKMKYETGDVLFCEALGNPDPTYIWKDLIRGNVIDGSILVLNSSMASLEFTFECTASNIVAGRLHTDVASIHFKVELPCVGTLVEWWQWYQAAVAIVTIDTIAGICFMAMIIVILMDNYTEITLCSRYFMVAVNLAICMIFASMMVIGCSIRLSRDTACPANCTTYGCTAAGAPVCEDCTCAAAVQWETGVIVMFAFLFVCGLASVVATGVSKCQGKWYLIMILIWDIITILVGVATLAWTLVNMSKCRKTSTSRVSSEWSWEIFLIAFFIAAVVFVVLAVVWYILRKRHCKGISSTPQDGAVTGVAGGNKKTDAKETNKTTGQTDNQNIERKGKAESKSGRLIRFGKVDVDVVENANPVSEIITPSSEQKRAKSASPKAKELPRTKSVDTVELQGSLQQQLSKPDSGRLLPPLRLQADEVYEKTHKKKKKKHRKHKHNEDEANKEGKENHHTLEEQQLDSENL